MPIRKKQCKACPWKKSTVPDQDIPGGYSVELHKGLKRTIRTQADLRDLGGPLHVMACHESPDDRRYPCVGWLYNQLGVGNNIGLRMQALDGRYDDIEVVGEQHERFEDTLPQDEIE